MSSPTSTKAGTISVIPTRRRRLLRSDTPGRRRARVAPVRDVVRLMYLTFDAMSTGRRAHRADQYSSLCYPAYCEPRWDAGNWLSTWDILDNAAVGDV